VATSLPTGAEGLLAVTGSPGWEALELGDYQRAETLFSREGEGAATRCGAGFALMGLSRFREAAVALDEALRLEPEFGPALLGQALLLRLRGSPEESLDRYRELAARFPQSAMLALEWKAARLEAVQCLRQRAGAQAESGRADDAAALYRRAIGIDPDISRLHAELAGVLEAAGRHEEAAEALERAVALADGAEADLHRERLARLVLEHGRPGQAVALFEELMKDGRRDDLADALAEAEAKLHEASLPPEYRELLAGERTLDRGGLAAIIALEWDWSSGAVASAGRTKVIRDIDGHWAGPYIRLVVDRGVISPYPDHTFRPGEPVSRGDLAHIACGLLGPADEETGPGENLPISDLSLDHRHADCVRRLVGLGLLKRYPDNTVRINDEATGIGAVSLLAAVHRRADS